ncbi:MAG: hypothetical protein R6V55_14190 [Desulfovermiculus sp.]
MSQRQLEIQEMGETEADLNPRLQAQKELTFEYYTLLTKAEQERESLRDDYFRQQEHLKARIMELEEKLESLHDGYLRQQEHSKAKVMELEEKLESQKYLTQRYHKALAEMEAEQDAFRNLNDTLQDQLRQQQDIVQKLHKQFQALLQSRRWRIGHALGRVSGIFFRRKSKKRADQRMQELFAQLEAVKIRQSSLSGGSRSFDVKGQNIVKWMEQLSKSFQAVLRSRRWRVGSSLISLFSRVLGRTSRPTSVLRMQKIFDDFQSWKQYRFAGSLTRQEMRQLKNWMDQLEKDFHALLVSRRWRLGCALAWPLGLLYRKSGKTSALEKMDKIFEDYRSEFGGG